MRRKDNRSSPTSGPAASPAHRTTCGDGLDSVTSRNGRTEILLRPFARDRVSTHRAMSGATPAAGRFSRGDSPSRVNDEQGFRVGTLAHCRHGVASLPQSCLGLESWPMFAVTLSFVCQRRRTPWVGRQRVSDDFLLHTRQLRCRRGLTLSRIQRTDFF